MQLSEEGCHVPGRRRSAMERGLAAMGAPRAKVIVTNDFNGTVRRLTGSTSYGSGRGSGVVAGKTMKVADGEAVIVVNNSAAADKSDREIERLLVHEAGHVLLADRGEEVGGRHRLAQSQPEWDLIAIAGLAMEEMRIERRAVELGYPPSDWLRSGDLDDALFTANADIVLTVTDGASSDVEHLMNGITEVFDRMTKVLAYLAAPVIQSGAEVPPNDLSSDGLANWADYVAPTWSRRLGLYRGLPSVADPIRESDWAHALVEGAALEAEFLSDIGFRYQAAGAGYSFTRLPGTDGLFTRRVERAQRQAGERSES